MTMREGDKVSQGQGQSQPELVAWDRCSCCLCCCCCLMCDWETGKPGKSTCIKTNCAAFKAHQGEWQTKLSFNFSSDSISNSISNSNIGFSWQMCRLRQCVDTLSAQTLRVAYLTDTQILHQFVSRTNSARTWASKARTWIGWTLQ